MHIPIFRKINFILAFALFSLLTPHTFAQANNPRPRITQAVDASKMTILRGNTHPLARAEFDRGAAPGNLPMEHMLLVLRRSPEQDAALDKLMAEQQDQSSPNYHHWLTPEQFGEQFGPADQDIQTITSWLESQGFQINDVAKGRTVIDFSGTAGQVQSALHAAIHNYVVRGEEHWANATDPSIPSALTPVVVGVNTLHNFSKKPMSHVVGRFTKSSATGEVRPVNPQFSYPAGCNFTNNLCNLALGPADFATIYNVTPLWNAGIDGTGQTIAVVTDSNINVSDVTTFRSLFGLPVKNPNVILNGANPGTNSDEIEAVLDVEWSGAVAKNATIDLVVSKSTNTSFGGDLSAMYIINNHLAPILSESFGLCELELGTAGNSFYNGMWQQAAAQGITVIVSTGDNGSAGCDLSEVNGSPSQPATLGLQVNGIASTPFNIAVGGTDFNDLSNPGTYWNTGNNSITQASALSYIPETTWNDSCTNAFIYQSSFFGFNSSGTAEAACNTSAVQTFGNSSGIHLVAPVGASGGLSDCTTSNGLSVSTCAGGYSKPSWQTGITPTDGKRDLPDVSLFGADGLISGSFYIVCEADEDTNNAACNLNSPYQDFLGVGGTSVSAQVFAGIMALVDQKNESSQGNANTVLYPLSISGSASSVFHNVTIGTIAMPCTKNTPDCVVNNPSTDNVGVLSGFAAGPGYNLATGLGSVNVANLVNAPLVWNTTTNGSDFNLSLSSSTVTVASPGGSGATTLTVTANGAFNGTVTLSCSALPAGVTCSAPTLIGSGTSTITFQTTAPSILVPTHEHNRVGFPPQIVTLTLASGLCISLLLFGFGDTKRSMRTASALIAFACVVAIAGCGGGGSSSSGGGGGGGTTGGTPLGTTVVIVTATSGTIQRSVAVTLTVN